MNSIEEKFVKCSNLIAAIRDLQSDLLTSPTPELRNDFDAHSNELFFMANAIRDNLLTKVKGEFDVEKCKFGEIMQNYKRDLLNYKQICETALNQYVSAAIS